MGLDRFGIQHWRHWRWMEYRSFSHSTKMTENHCTSIMSVRSFLGYWMPVHICGHVHLFSHVVERETWGWFYAHLTSWRYVTNRLSVLKTYLWYSRALVSWFLLVLLLHWTMQGRWCFWQHWQTAHQTVGDQCTQPLGTWSTWATRLDHLTSYSFLFFPFTDS